MHTSVQFSVFSCFRQFHVSERQTSLCVQIGNMQKVFRAIKHRIILAIWKVVGTSGAGRLCPEY